MALYVITIVSIVDPSGAAIPAAVDWAVGTLLGSVATGVAVLAVAFLGFAMLVGRLDWRTCARVVLGIFILFGAPMIARELAELVQGGGTGGPYIAAPRAIQQQPNVPKDAPVADPYAGAALQQR